MRALECEAAADISTRRQRGLWCLSDDLFIKKHVG